MIEAVYEGIILGLVLAFSFGPGFFALINTGITHGFRSAMSLAFGIFFSDLTLVVLIIFLLAFGAQGLVTDPRNQSFIGVIGGIILIIYGAFSLYSKPPKTEAKIEDPTGVNHLGIETEVQTKAEKKFISKIPETSAKLPNSFLLGVKGYFINLLNPFVWVFWTATATTVGSKFEFHYFKIGVFFAMTLGVVLSTDLLKGYVSHSIKHHLTPRLMKGVNIVSGVILIGFGLYLIYKIYFLPLQHGQHI